MLAAASSNPESLALTKLVLALVIRSDANAIPDQLQEHLMTVLKQAARLAKDSSAIERETLPESIELALELKSTNDLEKEIERLSAFQNIQPDLAQRLLNRITEHAISQA